MAQPKRKAPKKKRPRKRKPKTPREEELVPHKIVGHLVGARFNEHGEIVGEEIMSELTVFRPNFKHIERNINRAVKKAKEEAAAED